MGTLFCSHANLLILESKFGLFGRISTRICSLFCRISIKSVQCFRLRTFTEMKRPTTQDEIFKILTFGIDRKKMEKKLKLDGLFFFFLLLVWLLAFLLFLLYVWKFSKQVFCFCFTPSNFWWILRNSFSWSRITDADPTRKFFEKSAGCRKERWKWWGDDRRYSNHFYRRLQLPDLASPLHAKVGFI